MEIDFSWLPWEIDNKDTYPYVPNPVTEYPALLRHTHLNFCIIGVVVRSLYNLPPNARHCMALNALRLRYLFELPPNVFAFLHDRYHTFLYTLLPAFNAKSAEKRYFNFECPIDRISRMAWIPFPNSDEDETTFVRPLSDITVGNYRQRRDLLHPAHHPEVVAFLEQYYADSYDSLFEHVRRGETLSDAQFERFVHETTYHYWELLNNTTANIESRLLDALPAKFSVPLSSGYAMLR